MSTHVSSGLDRVQVLSMSVNDSDVTAALDSLRSAIVARQTRPATPDSAQLLVVARRVAAQAVSRLSGRDARQPAVSRALEAISSMRTAGADTESADPADLTLANSLVTQGWPGVLAAMLLAPAHQCPAAPLLEKIPDWLWGDYTAWLFADTISQRGQPGLLEQLEELHRWLERNPGSAAVRAAAEAWLRSGACVLPFESAKEQRRYAELRGRMLTRLLAEKGGLLETPPLARLGRPLRVGFVAHSFGDSAATFASLASFEYLPASAFDVGLFALAETDSATERHCRSKAGRFAVLAGDLSAQLETLRQAELDVLVFGGDLSAPADGVARLALHRIAPLQVANARAGLSTGLPEIDLYVSGIAEPAAVEPAAYTERLGLLRGPACSYSIPPATEETDLTRDALELPADVPLFAAVVGQPPVSAGTLQTWARVLAKAPSARLLIALAADDADAFCQRLEAALTAEGIPTSRVSVFPADAERPAEIRALLRLADVYLDAGDTTDLRWLLEALRLGRPVAAPGATARPILESFGIDELLPDVAGGPVELAARLASEPVARAALAERIALAVETGAAPCFDTLAASDAFGALIETAFDELCATERPEFRAQSEPVRCFCSDAPAEALARAGNALECGDTAAARFESLLVLRTDPRSLSARLLRARVLLAEDEAATAAAYLLAAVQQAPADAGIWFMLATALRQSGQTPDAIRALETSLRLDAQNVEGWFMMVELAERAGAADIASEALAVLRDTAPDDSRVLARH